MFTKKEVKDAVRAWIDNVPCAMRGERIAVVRAVLEEIAGPKATTVEALNREQIQHLADWYTSQPD